MLDQFYKQIERALDKARLKQKEIIINKNNPWHKGTLKQLRIEKFARYEKYIQDRNHEENKNKYYQTLAKYRKLCRQKQKKHERDYTEAIGNEAEMSKYLNKILKTKAKKDIGTLKKSNGEYTEPGLDTLKELANKHYPSHTEKKSTIYPNTSILREELESRYTDWITDEKIVAAYKGFECKKCPGPDGIKPITLKHLPPSMINSIKTIYKASIALHFTPTQWKSSKVVYIPKIGKDDYSIAKSYRPISLMNYLLKGLERLSVWIADDALEDHPLHIKQHGFQKGKSTETAISNTVNKIEKHILNGEHCMGVFLDIQAAFDSITPEHIKRALLKHGCHPDMVEWYYELLIHRNLKTTYGNFELEVTTNMGFPQGGVCLSLIHI